MPFVAATRSLGRAGLFSLSVLRASKPTADFLAELVREIYKIGARSLPIIAVGGAFVGLSVTLSGIGLGFDQMISERRYQPSACSANATSHGMPIRSLGLSPAFASQSGRLRTLAMCSP